MENNKVYELLKLSGNGLLNSYSQIFFSNSKIFASLLILTSFFDIGAGFSGVLSVLICQITALLFNFNKEYLRDGLYTYNALMVGLALGFFYDFNSSFFLLLILTSILTLFITIWCAIALDKKGLPFLSIPFLIGVWIIILGANNFSALELNQKELISLAKWFPELFTFVSDSISLLTWGDAIHLFLRSLGAIFFQFNDLAGIIIAIGILYYSRIAFGLSIFGFVIGYAFYSYFEGDFSQLIYSYIGFNFILTSIALGGFFVVPSRKSYLMLIFTIPVIGLLISALHTLFTLFQLPLYSLPFNIVTLLFLAVMAIRYKSSGITLVKVQQFSPEKNHYKHLNYTNRFVNDTYYHISLPLMGEWHIAQGHNGNITHKDEWQHAWDFDIINENNLTYIDEGISLDNYLCYNLPVIAPEDGTIFEIVDGIADNEIGKVNLKNNWGNTIIIKHGDFFYSKLSHIKAGTITNSIGDFVKKGDVVGKCGSSGRSPEPHLHFQMQATPFIGSKTLQYPIAYYLTKQNGDYNFHTFDIPKEGDIVSNIQTSKLLTDAFNFTPGKILMFNHNNKKVKWEIFTNSLNNTYIYCHNTKSTAYFVNNGNLFYFTDFYGKSNSLLHHFYYGAQKVLLGYYQNIELNDHLMIDGFFNKLLTTIHDFTAPFFHYCKVDYNFSFVKCDNIHNPSQITFKTSCKGTIGKKKVKELTYEFTLKNNEIESFSINNDKIAKCE